MNSQGGIIGGANHRNENIDQNQVGAAQTNSSPSSPIAVRGGIRILDMIARDLSPSRSHRRRRIRLSNFDSTGREHVGNNNAAINLDLNSSPTQHNVVDDQQELHGRITTNSSTVSLPLKRTTSDRQFFEIGQSSNSSVQAGPSSAVNANENMNTERVFGHHSEHANHEQPLPQFSSTSIRSHIGASSSRQLGPTQHGSPILTYVYTARNPLPVNMLDYSHIGRENVEPSINGQRNINQGNTMVLGTLPSLTEQIGSFGGNVMLPTIASARFHQVSMHELENRLMDVPARTMIRNPSAQTTAFPHPHGPSARGSLESLSAIAVNNSSIAENEHIDQIGVGGNASGIIAEQQPPRGPLLTIRDTGFRIRAVVEAQIQAASERLRSGQSLRIQDYMALDYQVLSRALEEERLRIQQIERNRPGLTEQEISRHIKCEHFEVVGEMTPEDKEVCTICQDDFAKGDEVGRLDCEHRFHINCIKRWLMEKNLCPLCKRRGLLVVIDVDD